MAENGLPCLDLLEATPGILRGLMTELTEEDARWKPAPERFSVAEVLAHLSHSETMRKCTSNCTGVPIRRKPSITSKISARPTSNFSATCRTAQATVSRYTGSSARSRSPRC
ncbi:MAG: hypothetical protein DMG83_26920 [Acidobacteria bacterium]|nr:MAG: hypothetical protein DMG83_26920 [Acidobacteriota bacterium]